MAFAMAVSAGLTAPLLGKKLDSARYGFVLPGSRSVQTTVSQPMVPGGFDNIRRIPKDRLTERVLDPMRTLEACAARRTAVDC
jgi:hypothetical protein